VFFIIIIIFLVGFNPRRGSRPGCNSK